MSFLRRTLCPLFTLAGLAAGHTGAAAAPAEGVAPAPAAVVSPAPVPAASAAMDAAMPASPVAWMGFQVGSDCRDGSTQQAFEQLAQRGFELPDAGLRCPVDVASPAPVRSRLRKIAADGSVSEVEELLLEYPKAGRLARIVWTRAWAPGVPAPAEAQLRDEVFALLGTPALVYERVLPAPPASPAPTAALVPDAAASAAASGVVTEAAPSATASVPAGDGLAFTAAWATVQRKPAPTTLYVLNAADWTRGTSRMAGVLTVAHVNRVAPGDASKPHFMRIDMRDSNYRAGR